MEPSPFIWITLVVAIVFIPPCLLLRPLVVSIADRIAGRKANTDDTKTLTHKVEMLELELSEMKTRMLAVEDEHAFVSKLLGSEKHSIGETKK